MTSFQGRPGAPQSRERRAESDAAFAVNVRTPFLLTALFAEKMAAGGGSIVTISSTAAGLGMPGMAVHGATKAALESLTRTWAAEFAESNVRVNAVAGARASRPLLWPVPVGPGPASYRLMGFCCWAVHRSPLICTSETAASTRCRAVVPVPNTSFPRTGSGPSIPEPGLHPGRTKRSVPEEESG
ncbi:SDR family NAD(P)-dependent oxidoreductase [Streptomyces sp. NPDC101062]|uniref:SDR family NAD(P)-dependent oxidoreductase n=1 Tax=unclassified Streptomyces TaxID=2593676 RepID=UPI00381F4FA1